jgi:competence ComEA-like helix-hairpin-helix protein
VRAIAHIAAVSALAAWALALGRWLRDPEPGAGLVGLLLLGVAIGLALRQLYFKPEPTPRRSAAAQAPAAEPAAPAEEPLWDPRVDLNAAGLAELRTLPGVGPVAAGRIVAEREAGGPFASVEDLVRVPGFGPAKVRSLADLVRV